MTGVALLARICSSALRPRGEVRVPVSHRGDPASIVLRLWKAVCPQSPRSPSAVSQQHIVSEPGDLRRDSRAPPTTCGGTDAPGSATCSVHGRVARRWVPAFETAPSDNLSPRTSCWPPRCECVCRAVPEAPPRVAASRLDAALAPGHSRDPRTWPQSQLQLIPSVSLWPQGAEAAETVRAWHVTVCRRPRCLGASSDGEQTPGASLRAAVCEFVRRDLCFRLVSEQAALFVGASPSVPPYGTILRAP